MSNKIILALAILAGTLGSCKKEKNQPGTPPLAQQVLLKDVTIPGLPSPYYHFTYNQAGKPITASFSSGLKSYEIIYNGNRITEVKNNTAVNKDRILYEYDEAGQLSVIRYINEANTVYRRAFLYYDAGWLLKIEFEAKDAGGFITERDVIVEYDDNQNLSQLTDIRYAENGPTEFYIDNFENYDNKVNTDAFYLFHKSDDHLLLLPGIVLQKNNPAKVTRTGTGINYIINYNYTYNNKNAPLHKTGNAVFTSGPNGGQAFQLNTSYTYY